MPKVMYTDNSFEFGKSCERLSWNHRTSTPHRSETSGIAERAFRRVKERTSAALLQSGLDDKWWSDSMECRISSRKSSTLKIPWNLAKPVKIFLGIIARLHHTDRKLMGLLKEQYAE